MLRRFILWDFPRGGWQYDVMVGIIVAFVFLTPRDWFRDQPRIPNARSIAMLPLERESSPFWIDKELLDGTPQGDRVSMVTQLLRTQTGNHRLSVVRIEPIQGSENEVLGYIAFAKR